MHFGCSLVSTPIRVPIPELSIKAFITLHLHFLTFGAVQNSICAKSLYTLYTLSITNLANSVKQNALILIILLVRALTYRGARDIIKKLKQIGYLPKGMFIMKKAILTGLNMVCLSIILAQPVYAYIDPATTSYVIQIVAGIVIACGATIGIFWSRIKRKVKNRKNKGEELSQEELRSAADREKDVITADDLLGDDDDEGKENK
jgi:phosphatidylglycerophosphate synthase